MFAAAAVAAAAALTAISTTTAQPTGTQQYPKNSATNPGSSSSNNHHNNHHSNSNNNANSGEQRTSHHTYVSWHQYAHERRNSLQRRKVEISKRLEKASTATNNPTANNASNKSKINLANLERETDAFKSKTNSGKVVANSPNTFLKMPPNSTPMSQAWVMQKKNQKKNRLLANLGGVKLPLLGLLFVNFQKVSFWKVNLRDIVNKNLLTWNLWGLQIVPVLLFSYFV